MLLMISLHAYFTVNAEELLGDRKIYVCDKVAVFGEGVLQRVGLRKWAKGVRNDRFNRRLQDGRTVQQFEDLLLHDKPGPSKKSYTLFKFKIFKRIESHAFLIKTNKILWHRSSRRVSMYKILNLLLNLNIHKKLNNLLWK